MELRDGDLLLRLFVADDAPTVCRICQDPEMGRFLPNLPVPYTLKDAEDYLEMCREAWEGDSRRPFAIVDVTSGELVGAVEVRLGDVGMIGYWVAPEARGRGFATRAVELLSRWALRDGGVKRLELFTHPDNEASQQVAEKAGFSRERIAPSPGRFQDGTRDHVVFALTAADLDSP